MLSSYPSLVGTSDCVVALIDSAITNITDPVLPAVIVAGSDGTDAASISSRYAEEAVTIARAVDRRPNEFASGLALLRRLLDHAGPVPVAANRSPVLSPASMDRLPTTRNSSLPDLPRIPD